MLLNFQKEAIWRQIQEYKRENVRAQERIERLKDHQVGYDERLSELDSHWSKVTMPSCVYSRVQDTDARAMRVAKKQLRLTRRLFDDLAAGGFADDNLAISDGSRSS